MERINIAPAHQSINEKLEQWKKVNTNSEKTSITIDRKGRNQMAARIISTSNSNKEGSRSVHAPVGGANVRYFTRENDQIPQTASRPTSAFFIPSNELKLSDEKISSWSDGVAAQNKRNLNMPKRISTDNDYPVILNCLDSSLRLSRETGNDSRIARSQPNLSGRDTINRGKPSIKTLNTKNVANIKTKTSTNTLAEDSSATRSSPGRQRIQNPTSNRSFLTSQPSRLKSSNPEMMNPESGINSPGRAASQSIFLEKNNISDGEFQYVIA